jgi:hypothetical protein
MRSDRKRVIVSVITFMNSRNSSSSLITTEPVTTDIALSSLSLIDTHVIPMLYTCDTMGHLIDTHVIPV